MLAVGWRTLNIFYFVVGEKVMRKLELNEIKTVSGANGYTCNYNYDALKDTLDLIEKESKIAGVLAAALVTAVALPFGVPVGIVAIVGTAAGLYTYGYEKQNHELSPWAYS